MDHPLAGVAMFGRILVKVYGDIDQEVLAETFKGAGEPLLISDVVHLLSGLEGLRLLEVSGPEGSTMVEF